MDNNQQVEELAQESGSDNTAQKEAQEKRESERREILSNALRGKIDNIRDRVAYILNNSISARNSDIKLAWQYWKTFESDKFNGQSINEAEMVSLTKISSLTRMRAKLQNEYKLFQANAEIRKFRGVLEDSKKQEVKDDKPNYPLYAVYIDETGKTQTFVSVGSLWITDVSSAFFAFFKLQQWKEERQIAHEFHFSRLSTHKLKIYKEFFLKFLSLFPSAGFKVIVVRNSGIKHIDTAITDLTFHLINKGIAHEDETRRAPLPRILQVVIDNEEEGSDNLKLANVKERITSQNIEGLYIDSFEAVDSHKLLYLEIVDLFVSSINRKLHHPHGTHVKDQLAEFVLVLLDFNVSEINAENNIVDKSKVFSLVHNTMSAQHG